MLQGGSGQHGAPSPATVCIKATYSGSLSAKWSTDTPVKYVKDRGPAVVLLLSG